MLDLVPLQYYTVIYQWVLFVICLLTFFYYQSDSGCRKLLRSYSILLPLLLTVVLIFYIGLRQPSWKFVDMMMYRHLWNVIDTDSYVFSFDLKKEWFFTAIIVACKKAIPDVQFFFFIVALFYVGCQFWACKRLLWENVWLACLFVFFSYQFYPFATNGIRNGMAAGIMLLSISYFCKRNNANYIVGFFLFILSMGCHRSMLIPMTALTISLFVVKDIKYAIFIWLACIVLSFFAGSFFQNIFTNIGFDDRMSSYSSGDERTMSKFSHVGFRWDFLLYSAMPVWMAWYIRYKGIQDKTFTLLANTYIIANSLWIMMIRVAFSNRFAYLSWFMYALVLAYAVIRVPIWKDQDRKAGQVLLAHSFFTFFMYVIGK